MLYFHLSFTICKRFSEKCVFRLNHLASDVNFDPINFDPICILSHLCLETETSPVFNVCLNTFSSE